MKTETGKSFDRESVEELEIKFEKKNWDDYIIAENIPKPNESKKFIRQAFGFEQKKKPVNTVLEIGLRQRF